MRILSTKNLSENQLAMLPAHFKIVQWPFVKIKYVPFCASEMFKIAIFTSQNAVKSVFEVSKNKPQNFQKIYALQGKTSEYLKKKSTCIFGKAKNAETLANLIIKQENNLQKIHFFCGNLRQDILPKILLKKKFQLLEHQVYKTKLTPIKLHRKFDKILFFSPSAVESYVLAKNNLCADALCIGKTTGILAKKYFKKVSIAKAHSVESVLSIL